MGPDPIWLQFEVPGGRLEFGAGDLDLWAEHLTWCYGFLGVGAGSTIAVQDFGASPLSFLGSSLLMPTLGRGVAERLGGRFLCLDASGERITLTPALLRQLAVDVLVARADALPPLLDAARKQDLDLDGARPRVVVAWDGEEPPVTRETWSFLLHVEASLLVAPGCRRCGGFHLRPGLYRLEGDLVRNLRCPSAAPHRLPPLREAPRTGCDRSPADLCLFLGVAS